MLSIPVVDKRHFLQSAFTEVKVELLPEEAEGFPGWTSKVHTRLVLESHIQTFVPDLWIFIGSQHLLHNVGPGEQQCCFTN